MLDKEIKKALQNLAKDDDVISQAIIDFGFPAYRGIDKGLKGLIDIIVSQQLSKAAANTIIGRLPEISADLSFEDLRACGVSKAKSSAILDLIDKVNNNLFNLEDIEKAETDDAIKKLTELKGIGPWSAEVYLLFSLRKKDVFPAGDLVLQNMLKKFYPETITFKEHEFKKFSEKWKPYRSAAACFLWHINGQL